jgi:predicted RNA binding protein YcfA (HicA-like mRNA interferase family)
MSSDLPAITGKELIRLLKKDGFIISRKATHGLSMTKRVNDRTIVTVIPDTRASLPRGVLMAILGPKQTRLGRKGLLILIEKYGLK